MCGEGTHCFTQFGSNRTVALHDDEAWLGVVPESVAEPRRHLGSRLDAGEPATGHDHRVASVRSWTIGQAMQMLGKGDRIVERVDAEAVLSDGNLRTKEPAARGHN